MTHALRLFFFIGLLMSSHPVFATGDDESIDYDQLEKELQEYQELLCSLDHTVGSREYKRCLQEDYISQEDNEELDWDKIDRETQELSHSLCILESDVGSPEYWECMDDTEKATIVRNQQAKEKCRHYKEANRRDEYRECVFSNGFIP